MLKSFDRYIIKEIAIPFTLGLLVYTFTLLIHNIFKFSDVLIAKRASTLIILKILIYLLPFLLTVTIPIATLMGVLAGLSRMSTDSEIVAFKTLGINNFRILKPIILFSIFSFLFTTLLTMYITPEANFRLYKILNKVKLSTAVSEIKPRAFFDRLYPYVLYIDDKDNRTNEWKNIFLYSRKGGENNTIITAKRGEFIQDQRDNNYYIILKNALVHSFKKKPPQKSYSIISYKSLPEEIPNLIKIKPTRRNSQLIITDLIKKLKENPDNRALQIELHQKFSFPVACLALGFLALSLGIFTKKGGNINGFIISLGITFIYYTIEMALENMAQKGIVSPFWGIWTPNILLITSGIILYYYSSKEKSIDWEKLSHFFVIIKNKLLKKRKETFSASKLKKRNLRIFNIIDIYIIKKITLIFFLLFFSLIFIFYIINVLELIDDIVEHDIAFHFLLKYIYYSTPDIISFVLPVSILTAVLLAFSLMSKNNEIIAVQVSGISLQRLSLPAIIIGILLSIVFFYIQENITPDANKKAKKIFHIIRKWEEPKDIEINKNWIVGKNNEFYSSIFDRKNNKYINFHVIYMDKNFNIKKRITSKSAIWKNKSELILMNGFERDFKNNSPISFQKFEKKNIIVKGGQKLFTRKIVDPKYLNIKGLKKYINYLKENKSNSKPYEAKLYHKYAFPFSSLIMVLIAIPFSFMMGKKGTIFGIGIAVGISMIFWFAFTVFSSLGANVILSPFISAFAPIFIFGAASIYLFLNIKT